MKILSVFFKGKLKQKYNQLEFLNVYIIFGFFFLIVPDSSYTKVDPILLGTNVINPFLD